MALLTNMSAISSDFGMISDGKSPFSGNIKLSSKIVAIQMLTKVIIEISYILAICGKAPHHHRHHLIHIAWQEVLWLSVVVQVVVERHIDRYLVG